ncbi:peroxisomal fatty acid beta-oxidation multifunctional protein AIM1-like protein, partial [Tanacetum coccineum]
MVVRKKLAQSRVEKTLTMIRGVLDYSEFKDVDMVIEAVIENVHLKQIIFSKIEK